jgi:hypothetical protein
MITKKPARFGVDAGSAVQASLGMVMSVETAYIGREVVIGKDLREKYGIGA